MEIHFVFHLLHAVVIETRTTITHGNYTTYKTVYPFHYERTHIHTQKQST